MNIKQVTVSAGRTYNHPYEQYSNFKHHVELRADLSGEEDGFAAAKDLQAKAEALAEEHKTNMLRSVEELREMTEVQREISSLEESLKRGTQRLDEIRKRFPNQPLLSANTHDNCNADPM